MKKLPTKEECLKQAWYLAIDILPKKTISKEEEMPEIGMLEGEVLPEEFIFYEEGLEALIKFCQGK